jgi:hypothetical protein
MADEKHFKNERTTIFMRREMSVDAAKKTPPSNAEKDPEEWVTGDEPRTGAQASYLKTLCEETEEEFNPKLTKAEASELIDTLKQRSPRLRNQ